MSKFAKITGLAEFVYELREAGAKWDAKGGIVEQVRAKFPEYTTDSAIPMRAIYKAHKAKMEDAYKIKATKSAVTKARHAGEGWEAIAGRAGITVKKAKELYNGEHPEGRIYVDQEGKISTVRLEPTFIKGDDDATDEQDAETTPEATVSKDTDGEQTETTVAEEVAEETVTA